ncbi:MAG: carboxypeptidase-like regulatory domain-containing protein, partial [Odoribacter sp.]|nr:carboxypeptidase-like regulatory domain-containing protein [Odoribacter sp.]
LADYSVDVEYQLNHTIVLRQKAQLPSVGVQKVNGTVIDAQNGEPLIGASVVLKEQRGMGVVTDVDGKFHIELMQGAATALVISYIGYETEELKLSSVDNLEGIMVKMTPMIAELEGVVVTGMAPRKASGFTGRYVTVKGEELKRLNPNNLLQALSIFDPSFHIVENNQYGSDPNRLPEFRLRGDVQLGASDPTGFQMMMGDYSNRPNMPLFILDGFETSLQRIVDLDPERVESITILKDAAGTAMYGSKASNGVIVFETKKPKPGALTLNYSGNVGVSVPDLSDYNLMNAAEKLEYERKAGLFTTTNLLNYYNRYKEEILRGINTYWLSQPLRTAITHRHTLNIEGGDEAIRYSLALNYGNEFGVMKGSDRANTGLTLLLSYRRKKWNISNSLSMTNTDANNSPYGSFATYTKLNPYYRLTDENGRYKDVIEIKPMAAGSNQVTITNPLYNTQFPSKDLSKNFSVVDNLSLEYAILENLRVNGQVSFHKGHARAETFKSSHHTDFAPEIEPDITKRGSYSKNIGESVGWSANASLNYNLVKDKHGLFVMARWNVE